MHVYLTGFMGAGKTTVGRVLAEMMNRPFVDLDDRLEQSEGTTISEIFGAVGEAEFRALEAESLRTLDDQVPAVVALGGGVQTQPENRSWLAEHGTTVWIDLPLDDLLARLRHDEQALRPMIQSESQIRKLFQTRLVVYDDSDLRIEVSSADSAATVAAKICELMEETQCAT